MVRPRCRLGSLAQASDSDRVGGLAVSQSRKLNEESSMLSVNGRIGTCPKQMDMGNRRRDGVEPERA